MSEQAQDSNDPDVLHIDLGLPESRKDWPAAVLQSLEMLTQGSVVESPPLFYYADPATPIWALTHQYVEGSEGPEIVESGSRTRPRYGIVTSQTCDIAEDGREQPFYPWVQVSPVYDRSDLNSGIRKLLKKGRYRNFLLYLPGLQDGFWVADLRIECPVEKGWFAGRACIDALVDETHRKRFRERLAVLRSRPAFGENFVEAIQRPLVDNLRAIKQEDADFFNRIHLQIEEVAVRMDDLLDPTHVQVLAICETETDQDVQAWFRSWWDEAVPRAAARGITLLPLEFRMDSELTLAEYRRMTVMPLERVSPN